MKKIRLFLLFIPLSLLFSSCATIIGGSTYNAHVVVNGSPNAKITMNDFYKGTGSATFPVKRKDADKIVFKVQEDGYDEEVFRFYTKSFRGWAFVGTLFGWTGIIQGIPLPWGVVVDFATGALWKPNVMENGVIKLDYKNFQYILNYTANRQQPPTNRENTIPADKVNTSPSEVFTPAFTSGMLVDVIYLNNGSVIKGIIIEQTPNVHLKIKTPEGDTYIFRFEDIEKIKKENLE